MTVKHILISMVVYAMSIQNSLASASGIKIENNSFYFFNNAGDVIRYDHKTGEYSKAGEIPRRNNINYYYLNTSFINGEKVLFENSLGEVGTFDAYSGKEVILDEMASCPIFVEKYNYIIYRKIEKKSDGYFSYSIYKTDFDSGRSEIIAETEGGLSGECFIRGESGEVIFRHSNSRNGYYIYNENEGGLAEFELICKKPVLGLSKGNILCLGGDGRFSITDMEGNVVSKIPSDVLDSKTMFPQFFVKSKNSILIQEYEERLFRSVKASLKLISLGDFSSEVVADDFVMTKRGAFE